MEKPIAVYMSSLKTNEIIAFDSFSKFELPGAFEQLKTQFPDYEFEAQGGKITNSAGTTERYFVSGIPKKFKKCICETSKEKIKNTHYTKMPYELIF